MQSAIRNVPFKPYKPNLDLLHWDFIDYVFKNQNVGPCTIFLQFLIAQKEIIRPPEWSDS